MNYEIDQLRVDALKAVYHNAVSTQGKCLAKNHIQQIQDFVSDKNQEFRKIAIKILSTFVDTKQINYKKLFDACLAQLEDGTNVQQSISYINEQTKDSKRCEELFCNNILDRICLLLLNENLDNRVKGYCCEVVNNCLQYSFTKGLSKQALTNYCYAVTK